MRDDGVVVVRMNQRCFTQQTIMQALATAFPNYRRIETSVSAGKSQTALFNRGIRQPGERDIVLAAAVSAESDANGRCLAAQRNTNPGIPAAGDNGEVDHSDPLHQNGHNHERKH